jgi:hypothetical protein
LIPVSERDDAVNLLDRRRTVQNLIDRALLQRSHSQVNRDTAEDVLGNLLEDEITQLLTHHHDLEDARAAHVAGLKAGRPTQAAMQTEVALVFGSILLGHPNLVGSDESALDQGLDQDLFKARYTRWQMADGKGPPAAGD